MSEKKTEIAFKILVYSGAIELSINNGFCIGLYDGLRELGYGIVEADSMSNDEPDSIGKYFPEIYKHKPDKCFGGYWFPEHKSQIRKEILETEIRKLFDKL